MIYFKSKIRGGKSYKTEVNRYYTDLNKRIHREETIDTQYDIFKIIFFK